MHDYDHGSIDKPLPWRSMVTGECFYLLIALITQLLLYPFLETSGTGRIILTIIGSATLVIAVQASGSSRKWLLIAALLAIPPLVSQWAILLRHDPIFNGIHALSLTLFNWFATISILIHILRGDRVTADKLYGSACAYILLGMTFASWHYFVEYLIPGSYYIAETHEPHEADGFHLTDFVYFSFTTMTSTGYGDIAPVTSYARSVAILEQITGVFYVAVLIARLAGLYPPPSERKET